MDSNFCHFTVQELPLEWCFSICAQIQVISHLELFSNIVKHYDHYTKHTEYPKM